MIPITERLHRDDFMKEINLKEYFTELSYQKLDAEMKDYKEKMFQLSAEEVFGRAYEIDTYINLYEILLTKIENYTWTQLWGILILPHVLGFFYARWLDIEDSQVRELDDMIDEIVEKEWDISREAEKQG